MDEVKYRATKLFNFPSRPQEENTPIAQCIISNSENICLYILYENSISILNVANGNRKEIQLQDTFLPIIVYDSTIEFPTPYICTEKGLLCRVEDDEIIQEFQNVGPNPFIIHNNQIIIGDHKSGIISLFDMNNQNQAKFIMNRSESFSLSVLNIFRNRGILSLAANSHFIFALSQERRVLVFDIENGQKVSSTTISGDDIIFGTIKCDEENYYVAFGTKKDTKIQAVHFTYDENYLLYEICHPIVNFIEIKNDNILIMSKNEVTLHDKSNGRLIDSFLLPIEDINIYKSKLSQNANLREIRREFAPNFAHLSNNNILYITTNSAVYRCRPILPIESYILNLRIDEEWEAKRQNQPTNNIYYAAIEFARTISRENWIDFDKNSRTTSDPTLFAFKVISQYLSRDYKGLDGLSAEEINEQINEIINSLHLSNKNHNQKGYLKEIQKTEINSPFSEFYHSACSEIIFAYSFFSRCIYFLVMFLTYKNQTAMYSHNLRILSLLVHDYTQLSLIAEIGDKLPIELFEIDGIDTNNDNDFDIQFSQTVTSLISRLLDFDITMQILMEHEMYDNVIEVTEISNVPLVYYGKALLKLKKYDEAVDFFIQNSSFLTDDKDLTEFVFQILRTDNRDDLIIRIGSINSVANAAALFRAYIKEMDYDSAFNCILTTQDEAVKCDMLRVFINIMKKNKLHERLLSYPFNTMISMFVNELWCYSKDTLILAVSFFREIGDPYQATQALYLYARCLLRTPTRKNFGKAFTAMNLVYCQMNNSNIKMTVRDVGSQNQELTLDKLWRIISRTRCCLLLDDDEDTAKVKPINKGNSALSKSIRSRNSTSISDAPEITFARLLEIAAQRNNDVFESALTGAHNEELIDIIPKLIHQKLVKPLYELLSIKNKSKNPQLVQKALETYIENKQVPPTFIIDKFIEKNATKLLMLCHVSHFQFKQNILFDVILSLLLRNDHKKFTYLIPIFEKLKVSEDIIEEFRK